MTKTLYEYKDIVISRDSRRLYIENSRIRRVFEYLPSGLRTVSLKDGEGREFASPRNDRPDFYFMGLIHPLDGNGQWETSDVMCRRLRRGYHDGDVIKVNMAWYERTCRLSFLREYFIYPGLPVLAVRTIVRSQVVPNVIWNRRRSLMAGDGGTLRYRSDLVESCVDSVTLRKGLTPRYSVLFRGRTDYTDDLVQIDPVEEKRLNGNLLVCRFRDSGDGLFILQEAPPSAERRDYERHDFRLSRGTVLSCGWGVAPEEFKPGVMFPSYRHVVGLFHSELEMQQALKGYLRTRYPFDDAAHGGVMVNPWGCGHFPEVADEKFLEEDIRAAARTGADFYQVDDGWQAGGSLQELTRLNRKMTPDFWKVSQRLSGSLDGLAKVAKECGVKLALWIAPSSNSEYFDWAEIGDVILDLSRKYEILDFKIDAVMIRTHRAEVNLRKMLNRVRRASGALISFNLDTTNGQRPGYFHFLEFGNIFLENRYVCLDWGIGYHPRKTLHTLWMLSRFMNPFMLQIEIPDVSKTNREFYKDYPYGQPDDYPFDYIAMIPMFASPLLWFTPSTLPEDMRTVLRNVLDIHHRYRKEIVAGTTIPIGSEPNGKSITGFQTIDPKTRSGFVLLFREKDCRPDSAAVGIQGVPPQAELTLLAGEGALTRSGETDFQARIDRRPGYVFLKYQERKD